MTHSQTKVARQLRKWRAANPEHVVEYRRRYYEANREKLREQSRAYRRAHPGIYMNSQAMRNSRKYGRPVRSVPGHIFEALREQPCFNCGKTPAGEVDHIIPFALGGLNIEDNLQPACRGCNIRKGVRERETLRMLFGGIR